MVANRKAHDDDGLYMTLEQYLALDEATDGKYEYLHGRAYLLRPPSSFYEKHASGQALLDLAGSSPAHAALSMRVGRLLGNALDEEGPCTVYSSDAYVKVVQEHVHPDVTVACGEQEEGSKYITNPIVVVEVLSPSTEQRDRGEKMQDYQALPSVQEYLLVGSETKSIELYRRTEDSWQYYRFHEGDTIELTSIGVSFAFDRVYRGIRGIH
jgi:Uma2 family endonuclease